jgi:hypothetical protein
MTQALYAHMNNKTIKKKEIPISKTTKKKKNGLVAWLKGSPEGSNPNPTKII